MDTARSVGRLATLLVAATGLTITTGTLATAPPTSAFTCPRRTAHATTASMLLPVRCTVVVSFAPVAGTSTDAAKLVAEDPVINVDGANSAQHAAVADTIARFHSAGLVLPSLEIAFSDDEAECGGHGGAFLWDDDGGPWRVRVCSDLDFVIPHELAHAWTAANLSDIDRVRYLAARGLTHWRGANVPWTERGTEDAAFIIQQNLRDVTPNVLTSPRWQERMNAFELLTRRTSPLREAMAARHGACTTPP